MTLLERMTSLWAQIRNAFGDFDFSDFLDILLVAFIVYSVIKLIRETRAVQLAKGLLIMGVGYLVFSSLRMQASIYMLNQLFKDLILVLIILFQPEIRHALESMGRSSLPNFRLFGLRDEQQRRLQALRETVRTVTDACVGMSEKKVGALIVFERGSLLGDVTQSGTVVDAAVTQELIHNVFYPKAPLHDGAAVIRGERLYAAGCVLPLTQNQDLPSELGMRHRAALGMSETGDAAVIVTSEETGHISVALKGELTRDLSDAAAYDLLVNYLSQGNAEKAERRRIFGKNKDGKNDSK